MKYKKYPKYKDSGVEWIGEIPEGWDLLKARFFITIHGNTIADFTENDEGIPYYKVDDLNYVSKNMLLETSKIKVLSTRKSLPPLVILLSLIHI